MLIPVAADASLSDSSRCLSSSIACRWPGGSAALMVIVWQFGSVLLFTAVLTLCRRYLVPAWTLRSLH